MEKKIAFFTHNFLEPTHNAIAYILKNLNEYVYDIYSKRVMENFLFENVDNYFYYTKGEIVNFHKKGYDFMHTLYDGKTALRAGQIAFQYNIPYIVSFHGGYDTNSKIFDDKLKNGTVSLVERSVVTTVVSSIDAERLKSIGIKKNITIIPVPIDEQIIPKINKNRDKKKLIVISRLIPKKGVDVAINAISKLSIYFSLTIIGEGEEYNRLKQLSKKIKVEQKIKWLGYLTLKDTLIELNNHGILLHPSRIASNGNADGTPQIILFSQAMKIPVISTNTGGIPSIISHNKTGILINQNNSNELTKYILELNQNISLYNNIISEAAITVKKHFSKNILKKWNEVYSQTMSYYNEDIKISANHPKVKEVLNTILNLKNLKSYNLIPFNRGGMGIIFISEDKTISIKIPAYFKRSVDKHHLLEQSIKKESNVLKNINSNFIPKLIEYDIDGKYIIKEYIPGRNLHDLIKYNAIINKNDCIKKLLLTAKELFQTFHNHKKGCFLIRDFKPKNLILNNSGVYLIDFGSIRHIDDYKIKNKKYGKGKWLYWSPEQLSGEKVDISTDYFSLGIIIFQILTGKVPYSNNYYNNIIENYLLEYNVAIETLKSIGLPSDLDVNIISLIIKFINPIKEKRLL